VWPCSQSLHLINLYLQFGWHLQIKIHGSCPGELEDVVKQLEEATGSVTVGQIGRTLILYRPSLSKLKVEEKKKQVRKLFLEKQNKRRLLINRVGYGLYLFKPRIILISSYASLMFLWNCRVGNKNPNHHGGVRHGKREEIGHKHVVSSKDCCGAWPEQEWDSFMRTYRYPRTGHCTCRWEFRDCRFLDQGTLVWGCGVCFVTRARGWSLKLSLVYSVE
jgi:hypothetical protein